MFKIENITQHPIGRPNGPIFQTDITARDRIRVRIPFSPPRIKLTLRKKNRTKPTNPELRTTCSRTPNSPNLLDDSCLHLIARQFAANLLKFVRFVYFVLVAKFV
jgi:hypothetical protein